MVKIVACLMGQNHLEQLKMCSASVKDADIIVYCDGGSTDGSVEWAKEQGFEVIEQPFDQEDPLMNGKQRNFYLEYLKKKYDKLWILCLDIDEIVDDLTLLKTELAKLDVIQGTIGLDVKMRHLIGDFRHEDSTVKEHFVQQRLFRLGPKLYYPLGEHVILHGVEHYFKTTAATIWHLAYADMSGLKARYEKQRKHSNIHSQHFLREWYLAHLFGLYPNTELDPRDLPQALLDGYGVEFDELYFKGRGLEVKHFLDAINWKDEFKPERAIEFGCGLGPRVFALNSIGVHCEGIELSQWAVDHALHEFVGQGDVTDVQEWQGYDLVIAYDLLEHIPYDRLEAALTNLKNACGKYLLVSIPTIGNPDLEADPTHRIKETRSWWSEHFKNKGFVEKEVPEHFLFKGQLFLFEKWDGRVLFG